MKINKKWLVVGGVVLSLMLAGFIGGIAVMADNSTTATTAATTTTTTTPPTTTTTTTAEQTFINDVVAAYQQSTGVTIDATALQNAITTAQTEMRTNALQTQLQNLVSAGKLTQDQANQILSWWQSMPSVLNGNGVLGLAPGPGLGLGLGLGCFGGTQ